MEKYLNTVSEMHSQFKQRGAHPMEKYIGRHAAYRGRVLEVVGYSGSCGLIVDGAKIKGWGWKRLNGSDAIFKKCEKHYYVGISDLID